VREGCFNLIFGKRGLKRAFQGGTPPIRLKIRHMLVLSGLKKGPIKQTLFSVLFAFLGLYKKGEEGGKAWFH
jgi:hypothetical protein